MASPESRHAAVIIDLQQDPNAWHKMNLPTHTPVVPEFSIADNQWVELRTRLREALETVLPFYAEVHPTRESANNPFKAPEPYDLEVVEDAYPHDALLQLHLAAFRAVRRLVGFDAISPEDRRHIGDGYEPLVRVAPWTPQYTATRVGVRTVTIAEHVPPLGRFSNHSIWSREGTIELGGMDE